MNNNPKFLIIVGIIISLLVIGGIGFWYWSKNKQVSQEAPTLGGQIFEKTQNQLEGQVPDTNPFKDQKNSLDTIYQNPFE